MKKQLLLWLIPAVALAGIIVLQATDKPDTVLSPCDKGHIFRLEKTDTEVKPNTDRIITDTYACVVCGQTDIKATEIIHTCEWDKTVTEEPDEAFNRVVTTVSTCRFCGDSKTDVEVIPHVCEYETSVTEKKDKNWNLITTTKYSCPVCGKSCTETTSKPAPVPSFDPNDWKLLLVNRHHTLSENPDVPLTWVAYANGDDQYLDSRCAAEFKAMVAAAKADGIALYVCSTYRPWSGQQYLYNNKVNYYINKGYSKADAQAKAALETAIPGTSEHQTGLAVDILMNDYRVMNESQENTAAQKWLKAHCWEYGFILRYPSGKTEYTGIIYEPWHYRYVGREIAEYLTMTGKCLEELLDPDYRFTDINV